MTSQDEIYKMGEESYRKIEKDVDEILKHFKDSIPEFYSDTAKVGAIMASLMISNLSPLNLMLYLSVMTAKLMKQKAEQLSISE